jgi:hypothetical protein
MPDLPTLTLSQAHYDRVVAAFPGATAAQKAEAYNTWLVNRLIERVESVEIQRIQAEAGRQIDAAIAQLKTSLPAKTQDPPFPA